MTINALLIEAADALQSYVDQLVESHTMPSTGTLDDADVVLKVESEQDLVNRLREAALVVENPAEIDSETAKTRIDAGFEGGGQQTPATATVAAAWVLSTWLKEVQQLSCMASTAMHQGARDQRNILEVIADRLCKLHTVMAGASTAAPVQPAPVQEPVAWAKKAMELAEDLSIESLRLGSYERKDTYQNCGRASWQTVEIRAKREAARERLRQHIYTTPPAAPAAQPAPVQEPVWTLEECKKAIDTLNYIQGIAERGEGRAMRDNESLDQFVLGYVKKLEAAQPAVQAIPLGCRLVPLEPCLEVLHAAAAVWESLSHNPSITSEARFNKLYRAMLAATPPAQPAPVQEPVAICQNCLGTKRPHADDPDWRGRCDCTPPAAQPAPAPGYCKHCEQYTIDEPLAQPAVPLTELVDYILQDDIANRLTPRVVDIAYSAFLLAKHGQNKDDGGPCDWFNDTKPMVMEALAKIRKDLAEAAHGIAAPAQKGEKP